MKTAVLICVLLVLVCVLPCMAQDAGSQESPEGQDKDEAGKRGMGYGAIMVAILIMVALPSAALLLITKIVGIGIEEIGLIRCVYTSLIFFAATGLIFYYFAHGLEKALSNPAEFFNDTNLLVGLGISFVIAFLLIHFVLGGTLIRALLGTLLFVLAFYGSTYLAYGLIVKAGAQDMLKGGVGG